MLPPSTRKFDLLGKLDEYRSVETLRDIVVIEPDAPQARLWFRSAPDEWQSLAVDGPDASIDLASVRIEVPMREIYEGLDFPPRPQLVAG